MKTFISAVFFFLACATTTFSQVEFGAVGSYWIYGYESHNGNGGGWDMIEIEKDTLINNEVYKILRTTYFHAQNLPPLDTSQGSYRSGLMQITNDSVYINGRLILDFTAGISDSLLIPTEISAEKFIQLAIDSITTEQIDGFNYQKWHGQKICVDTFANDASAYESFQILEGVGQIGPDYLLWNTDNCTIGGGFRAFNCHRNGDFQYPPLADCERRTLVSIKDIVAYENLKIYPNPTTHLLYLDNPKAKMETITIADITGKILYKESCHKNNCTISLQTLERGVYLVKIESSKGQISKKFVKM